MKYVVTERGNGMVIGGKLYKAGDRVDIEDVRSVKVLKAIGKLMDLPVQQSRPPRVPRVQQEAVAVVPEASVGTEASVVKAPEEPVSPAQFPWDQPDDEKSRYERRDMRPTE